jgi:succinyl-CoA synthetase alpha subunit
VAILINENTHVLIQGITGRQGQYHSQKMLEYGVKVVAGVTPGKGGQKVHNVPVYDTVEQACANHQIDASLVLIPPAGVLSAVTETLDSDIELIVVITEFVPFHDTLKIKAMASEKERIVIGPNTPGIISPGKSMVGIMPGFIYSEGNVGLISRSGTLTHEIASNLTYKGIGQSTCVGIGGDMDRKTDFVESLKLFRDDDETTKVILIGEIGGIEEEKAAAYLKKNSYSKEVLAFVAGVSAPPEKRMGHAGAIVCKGMGTGQSKLAAFKDAGVKVVKSMDELLRFVAK